MALLRLVFLLALATLSSAQHISVDSDWYHEDGSSAYWTGFEEGDTAVLRCEATVYSSNDTFDSFEIQWLRPGNRDWVTIADRETVVFFDGRDRFSSPNLTMNSHQNVTIYTMHVGPVDRYDSNTPQFGCQFGFPSSFTSRTATGMKVNWDPPSATCSGSIAPDSKAEKGDDVSRFCTATDVDRLSRGSLTLWNGDVKLPAGDTDTPLSPGFNYSLVYTDTVTDDTAQYVYTCLYSATGGYQDYRSNCTFTKPLCVVDDLADPCPGSMSGATDPRQFLMSPICVGLLVVSSRFLDF